MSWHVLPRGLVALFGTLTLSVALASAIGHPEYVFLTWMLTFGFAFVAWAWAPPPSGSPVEQLWFFAKTAAQLVAWILVWFLGWVFAGPLLLLVLVLLFVLWLAGYRVSLQRR